MLYEETKTGEKIVVAEKELENARIGKEMES